MEYSEMISYVLFGDLCIGAYDVVVTYNSLFYFCSRLDAIPISDLGVVDVRFDAEDVIASDTHSIVLLCWLEHNNRSFLNDVVIPKDDLKVLLLFFADNRASWIDYTPFPKRNISNNLIEPQIYQIVPLIHQLQIKPKRQSYFPFISQSKNLLFLKLLLFQQSASMKNQGVLSKERKQKLLNRLRAEHKQTRIPIMLNFGREKKWKEMKQFMLVTIESHSSLQLLAQVVEAKLIWAGYLDERNRTLYFYVKQKQIVLNSMAINQLYRDNKGEDEWLELILRTDNPFGGGTIL